MSESYDPGGPPPPPGGSPARPCPNCGQPVSPDSDFCPHCGYDLRKRRSSFWPAAIIAVVALLIGAGIALAVAGTGNDKTKTVTKNVVTGAPTSKTNVTVTAPERTVSVPGPTQTITVTIPTTPSTAP